MKCFRVEEKFGLENLKLRELEDAPLPGSWVRVCLRASSLNYRDLLMAEGLYNPRLKLPYIPLSDGAGTVEEVGTDCSLLKEGDRVLPLFSRGWMYGSPPADVFKNTLGGPLDGTLATHIIAPESAFVTSPSYRAHVEAATLPCAALTAWNSLVTFGNLKPGQTVLILGTGGVSIFALQIARLFKARVIVTSSDSEKLEKAKALGADLTINYREVAAWHKPVREFTEEGVDIVVEVGGALTLEQSIKSVKNGGIISLIGILSGSSKDLNLLPVLMRNIKIQGILVGNRQNLEEMLSAFQAAELKPVIDKTFEFQEAVESLQYLKSASHFGKVCLQH